MTATQTKLIMYYEIHRLHIIEGMSVRGISKQLVCDRRTVSKYLSMNETEYFEFIEKQRERNKVLSAYEPFVYSRLDEFNDTSAAQMHDWLKEHYPDFPRVSQKTIYNFVFWIRERYNIPFVSKTNREYFTVQELPFGKQAQVDFGEYSMRRGNGRIKVYFFVLQLCSSRMKYLFFQLSPFTSHSAIQAHEMAFRQLEGIPEVLVYDQDRVFLVDENLGEYITTKEFGRYASERKIRLHFCHKYDPESKGKIENVVRYVKQNFLHNRIFEDIQTLNEQAGGWLVRTGNGIEHTFTKKIPYHQWLLEKQHLQPYYPLSIPQDPLLDHGVLKDNTIRYRGNIYSLPTGTYKDNKSKVLIREEDGTLLISNLNNEVIATHTIPAVKGIKVINNNHKRDNSRNIEELALSTVNLFRNKVYAQNLVRAILIKYPRNQRDQLTEIRKAVSYFTVEEIEYALQYCIDNNIINASDFHNTLKVNHRTDVHENIRPEIKTMSSQAALIAMTIPNRSSIDDYQNAFIINK